MPDENHLRQSMDQVFSMFTSDIASLRTGRASASLVENLVCPAYGGTQRLRVKELASITSPDPQSLVIDPWDKSIIGDIKKGLLEANVGLSPAIDGEIIRLSMQPLTTEDKEKLTKLLSQKAESAKVMVRNVRAEAMKKLEVDFKDKQFGEDDKFRFEKQVQAVTDEFIGKIDTATNNKKTEILAV